MEFVWEECSGLFGSSSLGLERKGDKDGSCVTGADASNRHIVPYNDGFTIHYNDPTNSVAMSTKINLLRQHYFTIQGITMDGYLPSVTYPHSYIPGYEAEHTYF